MARANRVMNDDLHALRLEIRRNRDSASSQQRFSNNSSDATKLFVGNLNYNTTRENLETYFGTFGEIKHIQILRDRITQRSKGYGFINFTEMSSVENVLKVPTHFVAGRKIDPRRAIPRNIPKKVKLFVGGLNQSTSADDVTVYFSQFGEVEDIMMPVDQRTLRHRGFVFVTFKDDNVIESVCTFHCHYINGKKVQCNKTRSPKSPMQCYLLNNSERIQTPPVKNTAANANQLGVFQPHAYVQPLSRARARGRSRSYRYSPYHRPGVGPLVSSTAATTTSRRRHL